MTLAREVWVLFPASDTLRVLRKRIRGECQRRHWLIQERATETVRANVEGRIKSVLTGRDATNLYRRMHRVRVAVVALGKAAVCLHPQREKALEAGALMGVERFCRHKALYVRLDETTIDPLAWAARFEAWSDAVDCEGEHDARCLPLHVFKADQFDSDLGMREARSLFDGRYGSGARRTDEGNRSWLLVPHGFHGHEQLHVAGYHLRRGFHWDVTPAGASTVVATTSEVWKISRYVNIYPDAHVRGQRPHAWKLDELK